MVWLAGVGAAVALFVSTVLLATRDFTSFTAPGAATVRLDAGDERGIFVHSRGSSLGAVDDDRVPASALACRVSDLSGRQVVAVSTVGEVTLTHGDDRYVSRLAFEAPAAGRYRVQCSPAQRLPMAVGPKVTALELVLRIVGMFAAGFAGLAGAGGIALLVYLRRNSHKRRLQQQQQSAAAAFGR